MQSKFNIGLLASVAATLCLAALVAAWYRQSNVPIAASITVKLPPLRSGPRPGFTFR